MRRGAWNRDGREPAGRPVGRGPGVARLDARPHRSSMKISAKGEDALKAMLDLSMRESSGLVSIQEIAARQSIPQHYLEQVLLQLKRASLLTELWDDLSRAVSEVIDRKTSGDLAARAAERRSAARPMYHI